MDISSEEIKELKEIYPLLCSPDKETVLLGTSLFQASKFYKENKGKRLYYGFVHNDFPVNPDFSYSQKIENPFINTGFVSGMAFNVEFWCNVLINDTKEVEIF